MKKVMENLILDIVVSGLSLNRPFNRSCWVFSPKYISLDKHWHATHIIASIFDWLFKYVRRSLSFTIILQKLTAGTLLNQERFGTEQEMEQLEKNERGMNDLAEGPCFFRINIKRFQINRNMPSPNYVLTLDFVSYNLISCYFLNFWFCTR